MKTLLLMRHAKSSWKDDKLSDLERPLKKRGRRTPNGLQGHQGKNLVPDVIISSPAVRTLETVKILKKIWNSMARKLSPIIFIWVNRRPLLMPLRKSTTNIIPSWSLPYPGLEAYLQIIGGKIEAVPTAGLGYLVLVLEDWKDISLETMGELVGFWKPKELRESKE